jgi:hypothetical protein
VGLPDKTGSDIRALDLVRGSSQEMCLDVSWVGFQLDFVLLHYWAEMHHAVALAALEWRSF